MAKARQAVAESALDEILLNQNAALAHAQRSAAGARKPERARPGNAEGPGASTAAPSENGPAPGPRNRPQQAKRGAGKTCGEDGGKPAPDDVEILYAKVPGDIMRAMKLHLVFNDDPKVRNVKELLVKTLSSAFAEEIKEVQARGAAR